MFVSRVAISRELLKTRAQLSSSGFQWTAAGEPKRGLLLVVLLLDHHRVVVVLPMTAGTSMGGLDQVSPKIISGKCQENRTSAGSMHVGV